MKMPTSVGTVRLIVTAGIVAFACACGQRTKSPVVAKVGDAVLTLDDLYTNTPPEYRERITKGQNVNYVKQWIDSELLYQEALKRELHKNPDIRRRLERMRRDMLSAELLSRAQTSATQVHVSDSAVKEYYERNTEEFVRPKAVVRYAQIVVDNHGLASQLRRRANAENFLTLASSHSVVPVDDPRSLPYVAIDELPAKVENALAGAPAKSTRGPLKLDNGYCLIHVLDRQEAGSVASLDEVRDDIIEHLTAQAQKREVENLLSSLRMQTEVTLNLDAIPGAGGAILDTNNNE